jgi:steroid delta-isomerase
MTTDRIIRDYFAALNQIDRAAYLACFSQDATLQDPYGGRPLLGKDGLNRFMDGMERTWDRFSMTPSTPFAAGDRIAMGWTATATAKSGKTAQFAGISVFTLNEEGLIDRLEAYWDIKAMLAQIS